MTRKTLSQTIGPGQVVDERDPVAPMNEWFDSQCDLFTLGLGQAVQIQQAMWQSWVGAQSAWWQACEPYLARGGEQLA